MSSVLYNHQEFSVFWRYNWRKGHYELRAQPTDLCGLCGDPDADKVPSTGFRYPEERQPDEEYVHQICEQEEQNRAFQIYLEDVKRRGWGHKK